MSKNPAIQNVRPSWSCPSRPSNRCRLVILVGLAASALLAPPAGAQHPAAVAVVFHSRLVYQLPPSIEHEISVRVAKICAAKFPHWRYRPGTDADFPQLSVELRK